MDQAGAVHPDQDVGVGHQGELAGDRRPAVPVEVDDLDLDAGHPAAHGRDHALDNPAGGFPRALDRRWSGAPKLAAPLAERSHAQRSAGGHPLPARWQRPSQALQMFACSGRTLPRLRALFQWA